MNFDKDDKRTAKGQPITARKGRALIVKPPGLPRVALVQQKVKPVNLADYITNSAQDLVDKHKNKPDLSSKSILNTLETLLAGKNTCHKNAARFTESYDIKKQEDGSYKIEALLGNSEPIDKVTFTVTPDGKLQNSSLSNGKNTIVDTGNEYSKAVMQSLKLLANAGVA